jgi:hypothetical protein
MNRHPARSRLSALRHTVAFLCVLLAASGAIESHNLANHHRSLEVGGLFDPAATHPGSAHHFERSEELREPDCASCALQTHARGVRPVASTAIAPTELSCSEPPAAALPALDLLAPSASPRGPPAV